MPFRSVGILKPEHAGLVTSHNKAIFKGWRTSRFVRWFILSYEITPTSSVHNYWQHQHAVCYVTVACTVSKRRLLLWGKEKNWKWRHLADGDRKLLRNVWKSSPTDTASYTRRLDPFKHHCDNRKPKVSAKFTLYPLHFEGEIEWPLRVDVPVGPTGTLCARGAHRVPVAAFRQFFFFAAFISKWTWLALKEMKRVVLTLKRRETRLHQCDVKRKSNQTNRNSRNQNVLGGVSWNWL
jgi:hypothetical protein